MMLFIILSAALCMYIHCEKSVNSESMKIGGQVSERYVWTRKFGYRVNRAKDMGEIIVNTCILDCDQTRNLMTLLHQDAYTQTLSKMCSSTFQQEISYLKQLKPNCKDHVFIQTSCLCQKSYFRHC